MAKIDFSKGIGAETSPKDNPGGLYRHPDTGAELGFVDDALNFGKASADAAVRMGFEYVGPLPEGYIKDNLVEATKQAEESKQLGSASSEDIKGLQARLRVLEATDAAADEIRKNADEAPKSDVLPEPEQLVPELAQQEQDRNDSSSEDKKEDKKK
jgi:hypothetical protein